MESCHVEVGVIFYWIEGTIMASVRASNEAYRAALAALGWIDSGPSRMSHPTLRGRAAHDSAGRAVRSVTRVRRREVSVDLGDRYDILWESSHREFHRCHPCETCGEMTGPHEIHRCDTDRTHAHTGRGT